MNIPGQRLRVLKNIVQSKKRNVEGVAGVEGMSHCRHNKVWRMELGEK